MLVSNALNLTEMINDASWLSEALTKADLTHRIEVFEVSADGENYGCSFSLQMVIALSSAPTGCLSVGRGVCEVVISGLQKL